MFYFLVLNILFIFRSNDSAAPRSSSPVEMDSAPSQEVSSQPRTSVEPSKPPSSPQGPSSSPPESSEAQTGKRFTFLFLSLSLSLAHCSPDFDLKQNQSLI